MEGWFHTFILLTLTTWVLIFVLLTVYHTSVFDYTEITLPPILASMSRKDLETITGNMLGDGCIRYHNMARDGQASGNARYEMCMSVQAYNYMLSLFNTVYAQYSSITKFIAYPNVLLPQHVGKAITQYYFCTRSLPIFTAIHSICGMVRPSLR
jgi:hypothetical protein